MAHLISSTVFKSPSMSPFHVPPRSSDPRRLHHHRTRIRRVSDLRIFVDPTTRFEKMISLPSALHIIAMQDTTVYSRLYLFVRQNQGIACELLLPVSRRFATHGHYATTPQPEGCRKNRRSVRLRYLIKREPFRQTRPMKKTIVTC